MDKTRSEITEDYRSRTRERGHARVEVLVPAARVPELKELARQWRAEARRKTPIQDR